MQYESLRQTVLDAVFEAVNQGLVHGTSGNVAMRDDDSKVIAITPSGIEYTGMTAGDIALCDFETLEWIDGPYKPSSELPMHSAVMKARPEIRATVHTHSMYATILAMGENPAPLLPITPPHCEFTPVGIVPFALPGSEDAALNIVKTLGSDGLACLIKNHGMMTCGKDMNQAMHATVYVEEMAQTTCIAKMLGTYEPMKEEDIIAMKGFLAANMAV